MRRASPARFRAMLPNNGSAASLAVPTAVRDTCAVSLPALGEFTMSARFLIPGTALALLGAFAAIGCSREKSETTAQSAGGDVEKEKDKPGAGPQDDRDGREEQDKKGVVDSSAGPKS